MRPRRNYQPEERGIPPPKREVLDEPSESRPPRKLDRLDRDLRHLVNAVHELTSSGVGFKVLTVHGATIDTTTASGKLVFGFFAALAEFERELIVERTRAGMAAAHARGRAGGRPYKMTAAKLRLAMASMGKPETKIGALYSELEISRQTLYRHVGPDGTIRSDGRKLLQAKVKDRVASGEEAIGAVRCSKASDPYA